ncbi:MAG: hypothetical protein GF349_04790 [Candidatus Magasanikbacteria bacterium]|nr:hypothetical protein [Candidatus Magasanikbacteria bacterium]
MRNTEQTSYSSLEKKHKGEIWPGEISFTEPQENKVIKRWVKNPDNFLGKGGAGMVFDLGDQCIKLIENRHASPRAHMFNLGNIPVKEFTIQRMLNDFEIKGVFSPQVIRLLEDEKISAIMMERLDAVNMQMVMNGKEELPKKFDLDDFFERLEDFILAMHGELGVAHNDLEARNIMIDKKTGLPRVIDFGRSVCKSENTNIFEKAQREDDLNLNKLYEKMEEFLDKLNK